MRVAFNCDNFFAKPSEVTSPKRSATYFLHLLSHFSGISNNKEKRHDLLKIFHFFLSLHSSSTFTVNFTLTSHPLLFIRDTRYFLAQLVCIAPLLSLKISLSPFLSSTTFMMNNTIYFRSSYAPALNASALRNPFGSEKTYLTLQ
ncbi:MAG: hypothetical protein JOS17DRAFT_758194 [Linnemannia elongata]|nr:MAG: hypothetical protein JOS17DRAFT_758194 [Linnemannia elongata]